MNILFIANAYTPALSGVAISTHRFKESLEKAGHHVTVIAPRYPNFVERDPNVLRVRTFPNPFYPEYPLTLFRISRELLTSLRAKKIQVVHVMQPFTIGRFAVRLAHKLNVPIVFTHHARYDLYAHYVPLVPKKIAMRHILRSVTRFANRCDSLVAPSNSTQEFMRAQGITRPITVIPTGLTFTYASNQPKPALRQALGLAANAFVLVCVSRIAFADKNLPLLLRVVAQLKQTVPSVHLLMVGGGPDLARLKQLVAEQRLTQWITVVGPIQNANLPRYYGAADVFTYPSLTETQGIITLEALSAGLPVVAVKAPGTIDFVRHEYNGLLTKNDPTDFAAAVLRLYHDTSLRTQLANHATKSVAPYTAAAVAQQLAALYRTLASLRLARD